MNCEEGKFVLSDMWDVLKNRRIINFLEIFREVASACEEAILLLVEKENFRK